MKIIALAFISQFLVFQVVSSQKVIDFDFGDEILAVEAFEKLESAVKSQTGKTIRVLIAPKISGKKQKEIRHIGESQETKLRNLPLINILDLLCHRYDVSYFQIGNLFVITENDDSVYAIRKELGLLNEDEDFVEIKELIETSAIVVVTKHQVNEDDQRVAVVTEVLRDEAVFTRSPRIGDKFPLPPNRFGNKIVSYGDGQVIFIFDARSRYSHRYTYRDNLLLSVKGITLTELKKLIEDSNARTKRHRQPSELARKS